MLESGDDKRPRFLAERDKERDYELEHDMRLPEQVALMNDAEDKRCDGD